MLGFIAPPGIPEHSAGRISINPSISHLKLPKTKLAPVNPNEVCVVLRGFFSMVSQVRCCISISREMSSEITSLSRKCEYLAWVYLLLRKSSFIHPHIQIPTFQRLTVALLFLCHILTSWPHAVFPSTERAPWSTTAESLYCCMMISFWNLAHFYTPFRGSRPRFPNLEGKGAAYVKWHVRMKTIHYTSRK